jgi:hypothetical protein
VVTLSYHNVTEASLRQCPNWILTGSEKKRCNLKPFILFYFGPGLRRGLRNLDLYNYMRAPEFEADGGTEIGAGKRDHGSGSDVGPSRLVGVACGSSRAMHCSMQRTLFDRQWEIQITVYIV